MKKLVQSYFSPNHGVAHKVIEFIDNCQTTLDIAIYSLTHDGIAQAIMRAKDRGVDVRVLTDKSQSENKFADDEKLEQDKIEVRRDKSAGLMHNKFCIDGKNAVGLGSFNWTINADTKNAENWNVIQIKYVVDTYQKEFNSLWELNKPK